MYVYSQQYSVEYCCDYVTMHGRAYRGSYNKPFNVRLLAGETIQWRSDASVTSAGIIVCGGFTPQNGPPPPTGPPASRWMSGMWNLVCPLTPSQKPICNH